MPRWPRPAMKDDRDSPVPELQLEVLDSRCGCQVQVVVEEVVEGREGWEPGDRGQSGPWWTG